MAVMHNISDKTQENREYINDNIGFCPEFIRDAWETK
jgi:hypothetical protein